MAKSKSGGTRSYLRGKIGADVYSVGKDGKGKKQQVVRSLAEVVSNPQTEAQMRGRMIMSTVMQAVAGLSQIVDHSFDGVPNGQPSISEFIRRNYALVKADVAAHPSEGNSFGLNKYQEKGVRQGAYIVSNGTAPLIPFEFGSGAWDIQVVPEAQHDDATVQNLLDAFGITRDDYFTLVEIGTDSTGNQVAAYFRYKIKASVNLTDVIGTVGINNIFDVESNVGTAQLPTLDWTTGKLYFMGKLTQPAGGCITSVKSADGWIHSETILVAPAAPTFTADVALPTYPVGAARFLNGGEI